MNPKKRKTGSVSTIGPRESTHSKATTDAALDAVYFSVEVGG